MMMPPKRKKNLKVDSTEKFIVLDTKELDATFLEEFTLPPIDSGMEAEEEKEVHLKRVIEQRSGNIPVPVITEVDDYHPQKNLIPSKYIKYHKDIGIEYSKSEEDIKLMNHLGISENEYMDIVNFYKNEIDGNQRVSNDEGNSYNPDILKKVIDSLKFKFLLRDECTECPSYVCFRKRILKPSRKNRRSETQAKEKVTRLNNELVLLIKMCDLNKENSSVDEEISKIDLEIVNLVNELTSKYGNIKNKIMNILNCKESTKLQNTVILGDLFHDILYNRDNIRLLKRKLNGKKTYSDEDIRKEWSAYQKYLKDNNSN